MGGFSSVTGDESIVNADNASFDGTERGGKMTLDGQLWIGSTVSPHVRKGTLTAGSGIAITNGSGSITIAEAGGAFTWTDVVAATQVIAVKNGYATDNAGGVVYTLPGTAAFGDVFKIVGKLGITTITPNANQQILIAAGSGTVGAAGTAVATNVGDCITFRCTTGGSSTIWRAEDFVGNWTLN